MAYKYGITNEKAPAWDVATWFNLPPGKNQVEIQDYSENIIYLYCFQSWSLARQQDKPDCWARCWVGHFDQVVGSTGAHAPCGLHAMLEHAPSRHLQKIPIPLAAQMSPLDPPQVKSFNLSWPWRHLEVTIFAQVEKVILPRPSGRMREWPVVQ